MKRMLPILLSLALAACASTPPAPQAGTQAGAADQGTVCDRDARTGSMLPQTRCTTAAEREAAKRSIDTVSESVRNSRSAPPSKGGS